MVHAVTVGLIDLVSGDVPGSGALVQFMKTGNLNGGGLPECPKYSAYYGETMILDDVSEIKNGPDSEARRPLTS